MGGIISMVIIVVGATYYFLMRLSGNKKAAQDDDIAGGAAWFVLFLGGIFLSMFLVIPNIAPLINSFEDPVKTILQIALGLICIYVPYKVACLVVPAKDQEK